MSFQRVVVLDTETTGLSHKNGDRIIEIACLELEEGLYPTGRSLHYYLNPEREVSQGAFNVHGIGYDMLKDKPLFSDIAEPLWEFLKDAVLVIHNADFDMGFLNSEFGRLNYPFISNDRVVDTLKIARKKFPGASNSLDALCQRFNISLEDREKHGAVVDIKLLASVYVELMQGGRQQSFLKNQSDFQTLQNETNLSIQRKTFEFRSFHYDEETSQHKNFILSKMKVNHWDD